MGRTDSVNGTCVVRQFRGAAFRDLIVSDIIGQKRREILKVSFDLFLESHANYLCILECYFRTMTVLFNCYNNFLHCTKAWQDTHTDRVEKQGRQTRSYISKSNNKGNMAHPDGSWLVTCMCLWQLFFSVCVLWYLCCSIVDLVVMNTVASIMVSKWIFVIWTLCLSSICRRRAVNG